MRLTHFKCTYIDRRRYSFKKTPNFLNLVLSIFRQQIEVRKCVVYNEDIGRYGAWDADKCTTVMSEQSSTLCECYTTGTFGKNYSTNLSTIGL